jgi:hypothetical protein
MRVISQHSNHVIQIRPQRSRALGDGGVEITQDPIYAVFTPIDGGGFLYENEKDAALKQFKFHGLTQHEDEATPSDPIYRLSILDTREEAEKNNWDAETLKLVEETLVRQATLTPNDILVIEATPIPAPFPAFDTYEGDPEQLILTLVDQGHDLERVLHYERTFGNKRPEIIEALEIGIDTWAKVSVSA